MQLYLLDLNNARLTLFSHLSTHLDRFGYQVNQKFRIVLPGNDVLSGMMTYEDATRKKSI